MAVYTRGNLNVSVNGKPIVVAATSSPGTQIHQAVAGTSAFEEIYIWASNVTGAAVTLTLEWGGVTEPDNALVYNYSIPPNSPPIPVATGQILQNSLNVKAFASVANAINLTGFVNRIT